MSTVSSVILNLSVSNNIMYLYNVHTSIALTIRNPSLLFSVYSIYPFFVNPEEPR